MQVRTQYPGYTVAVERYFKQLIPKISKYQSSNGGPIIAVQVENEYGGYGNQDSGHLEWLKKTMVNLGITEPLFTSDPGFVFNKENPVLLKNELKSINFKNKPEKNLENFASHFAEQPVWVMEFWAGWFDWWGEGRNLFDDEEFGHNLDVLLSHGASVNFYMFHGGTNFGFTSGGLTIARGWYTADVTS